MTRTRILSTMLAGVALGCGGQGTTTAVAPKTTLIKVDGSSTVYPATEAVAEEFQKSKSGAVNVTVGISGTGGGFKKFCRGEIDVADASRPILKSEMEEAKKNGVEYVELPICFDALTVAVHPQNTWCSSITIAELKKIWEPAAQGKITHWNQVRPDWPNEKFVLFGAGSDSGTFDYFTEAIVGKAKSSRGDFAASEDDNVLVQGIEGSKYSLGYIPYAYFEPHKTRMKAVAVQWEKNSLKEPVLPSADTVVKGQYNPLSRPLFIYVNKKSAAKPEVKEFVEFYLAKGPDLIREVKYVPLPTTAYEMGLKRFQQMQVGTGFSGVPEVGLPIDEILKRTPKS
jgi:phosphate transport system substrate-binding protein